MRRRTDPRSDQARRGRGRRTRLRCLGEITWLPPAPFTANADGSFTGAIYPLSDKLQTPGPLVVERTCGRALDFRVTAGDADPGVAWKKMSKGDLPCPRLRSGVPSFGNATNAVLVDIDGAQTAVWSRRNGHKDD